MALLKKKLNMFKETFKVTFPYNFLIYKAVIVFLIFMDLGVSL